MSLLSSHPQIKQYGEIVGESILRVSDVQAKIKAVGPVRYIQNSFKKRFYKHAVGMKILYHQLKERYAEKWEIAELSDILEGIRNQDDIKIIHLKRRNRLKTLISGELARLTKEYVKREQNSQTKEVPIALTPEQCELFFEKIDQNEKYFDTCFQSHPVLDIYYEDLTADINLTCNKISDFLGLKRCKLKSNTFKQSQKPLSERIQGYEELKCYFKNSSSELFFEE